MKYLALAALAAGCLFFSASGMAQRQREPINCGELKGAQRDSCLQDSRNRRQVRPVDQIIPPTATPRKKRAEPPSGGRKTGR